MLPTSGMSKYSIVTPPLLLTGLYAPAAGRVLEPETLAFLHLTSSAYLVLFRPLPPSTREL
jgi:hypothetical protein